MSQRITIDPVTRIEGHLRIDCEVDAGRVKKAWSSGTMWRGIETILQGRDPREAWIFTQRICGVCTTVHSVASVRAVENALNLEIPLNAQLIRNLVIVAHALHDHIVHFYQLCALDWVDVVSALKADPAKAASIAQSLSDWPRNSVQEMRAVQAKLKDFVSKGQLGIFSNGYWGHPAMRLPAEVNLLAVAHYLQALEYQRLALKAVAVLGSKTPNIQNLAVGGVANAINLDAASPLNMNKLFEIRSQLESVVRFVQQVYFPDVAAIGGMYAEWLGYGAGVKNYLAVPDLPTDAAATQFDMPGGIIVGGDLAKVRPIASWKDEFFGKNVTEDISRAYYDGAWAKHPYQETTDPKYNAWDPAKKYSWGKAPRLDGKPMQVGPRAQVLVAYVSGGPLTQKWANRGRARACSSPPSGGSRPAASAPRCSPSWRSSTGRCWWRTWARATPPSTTSPSSRRARSAASACTRRPAGSSPTGWWWRTGRSRTTRRWCPRPGTRAPATGRTSPGPTRPPSSGTRWPIPRGPSRPSGRSTPSTPASPAPSTPTTRAAARWRG